MCVTLTRQGGPDLWRAVLCIHNIDDHTEDHTEYHIKDRIEEHIDDHLKDHTDYCIEDRIKDHTASGPRSVWPSRPAPKIYENILKSSENVPQGSKLESLRLPKSTEKLSK